LLDGTTGTADLRKHVAKLQELTGKRELARTVEQIQQSYYCSTIPQLVAYFNETTEGLQDSLTKCGIVVNTLASVKARSQEYLWEPYLPNDQLIALYGPSHTAKSIIALDWAARITSGANWPDGLPNRLGPRKVLMLSAGEDAQDTVLKPRFMLAAGDASRLIIVQSVRRLDENNKVVDDAAALDTDCTEVSKVLEHDPDIRMVIVDPITNHMGDTKTNFEEEVRPVLMKLANLADDIRLLSS
jgi:AAA domain